MNYQIINFSRNELKIIIIGTILGGISQIICREYLKNHPELLNDDNSEKLEPEKPGLRRFFPRGGAIIQITGAKIVINFGATIIFVAKKGPLIGLILTSSGIIMKKIPKNAVSTIVRKALPTSHSDVEKGYSLVDGEKIVLDDCNQNLEYMFQMLINKDIPYDDKKKKSFNILMNYVDLTTPAGCIRFMLCIVSIFHVFAALNNMSSYIILMENLLEALKNGKISKQLVRLIIRNLLRKNHKVDPELMDLAEYYI